MHCLAIGSSTVPQQTLFPASFSRLTCVLFALVFVHAGCIPFVVQAQETRSQLNWQRLPDFPNALGVAGPFVGRHEGALLVAGGANFPQPVWENDKQWVGDIYALHGQGDQYQWTAAGSLPRRLAYGMNVSTDSGVLCIGGSDASSLYSDCFLLSWDAQNETVSQTPMPNFPVPVAYGGACQIGSHIYVAGGQTTNELSSAVNHFWVLDLDNLEQGWQAGAPWPGPARAFHLVASQNNGFRECLYIMGGRHQVDSDVRFLDDCWEYDPVLDRWQEMASLPVATAAGTSIAYGHSHILVLSGDDGSLFGQADDLRDAHPGFPKRTYAFHTITNTWTDLGPSPANQVTTSAVAFGDRILIPTGEVRPRVRSPHVWELQFDKPQGQFSTIDYLVLAVYLASLIGIGIYFSLRTNTTEDYFRASGNIPWWAAGCSIFATMLSSLTFTGIPSKAFAQDWVYAIGNLMIPVVAVFAVQVALPFYRRIDATSAYEYLERRFARSLRVFGSLSFAAFHVFRMAIVMSLTALALAVATPMTPWQSVVLMGVLSIIYCSLGGISAVIWTDTLQTVVLLGGAVLALGWLLATSGLSVGESLTAAVENEKLRVANWHWDATSVQLAIWVIILGGIGQNISSYTADQAVVQRYMTTKTQALAARSIWTNAILVLPATALFFGMGSALFVYYQAHPEKLDPTIATDQIFPWFIAQELPWGIAGLIVAAIFAAAQSTVSTSMNSIATTIVTDCLRPLGQTLSERAYLRIAQGLTIGLGLLGTVLAIQFIDPNIRSLFDQFIKVIGLFMGVLGGLFVLGTLVPRANALGAWIGVIAGSTTMLLIWNLTDINAYLYTAAGITTCSLVGWACSYAAPAPAGVSNLHIWTKVTSGD